MNETEAYTLYETICKETPWYRTYPPNKTDKGWTVSVDLRGKALVLLTTVASWEAFKLARNISVMSTTLDN